MSAPRDRGPQNRESPDPPAHDSPIRRKQNAASTNTRIPNQGPNQGPDPFSNQHVSDRPKVIPHFPLVITRGKSSVAAMTSNTRHLDVSTRGIQWLAGLGLSLGLAMVSHAADLLPVVPAPPEPAGMKALFNGKDLTGWDGDPRLWSVKDGAIHGETTAQAPAKGNTFLILKDQNFADFELRFSFRCNAANNSGVQYRSKHVTEGKTNNAWVVRGYQHEIRNEVKLPSVAGFVYDEGGKRGRIILAGEKGTYENGKKTVTGNFLDQAGYEKLFKLDDWNDVVIIAKGNHIQHFLNGQQIVDFTDNDPQLAAKDGIIALQLHTGKPMWTEFKNIRIK